MKQNSDLCRLWILTKRNPFFLPLVCGCAVMFLLLPLLGFSLAWYFALLLWALLWAVLEKLAPHGRPPCIARCLTPNFYAVRGLGGWWYIFQRRPDTSKDTPCKDLLRGLLPDRDRLTAALVPGKYRAVTHSMFINRLRRLDTVEIISCVPVYSATLEKTIDQLTYGRCRHCSGMKCPFIRKDQPRTFYDVKFRVIR